MNNEAFYTADAPLSITVVVLGTLILSAVFAAVVYGRRR